MPEKTALFYKGYSGFQMLISFANVRNPYCFDRETAVKQISLFLGVVYSHFHFRMIDLQGVIKNQCAWAI